MSRFLYANIRNCLRMQKHLLQCPSAKPGSHTSHDESQETQERTRCISSDPISQRHTLTKPQANVPYKCSLVLDEALNKMKCAPLFARVRVWSDRCHCAYWLSVSALTVTSVISQQFTRSRSKWDLPGSLSKYLKQKIDVTVCLPHIFHQLANCFLLKYHEALIIQMLFCLLCFGLWYVCGFFFFFHLFLVKLGEFWLDS